MPIEMGIWRIDGVRQRITPTRLDQELRLEELLEKDPTLLGEEILIIGRQVPTAFGHQIDLLGVGSEGELVVIELKRDRTPRDVVAQVLDYASWVQDLGYADITRIFDAYVSSPRATEATRFEATFSEKFHVSPPEALNQGHRLLIVASELDLATERIITYLSTGYGVPINAVFFQCFGDGGREYLTRTWLRDPKTVKEEPPWDGRKEPWNGHDFYVSFGEGDHRTWEDAVRYGFVSGGQGQWYSRTLETLFPGARVFVCIPGTGYVGVGTVEEEAQRVKDFTVEVEGRAVPILEAPLVTHDMGENADDPEKSEYLVRVEWIKTLPKGEAIWEKGMFANQNTACKLRNRFTLERLKSTLSSKNGHILSRTLRVRPGPLSLRGCTA